MDIVLGWCASLRCTFVRPLDSECWDRGCRRMLRSNNGCHIYIIKTLKPQPGTVLRYMVRDGFLFLSPGPTLNLEPSDPNSEIGPKT